MNKVTTDCAWWEAEAEGYNAADTVHGKLFSHVRALEQDQSDIHYQNRLNARLYANRDMMAFSWDHGISVDFKPLSSNLDNVINSVISTKIALIGKNRPKATPVPRGADFDVHLRARQLDKFLYGAFLSHNLWQKTQTCYEHAEVMGTGVMQVDIDKVERDVFVEPVNPDEIVVDQRECMSCDYPTTLNRRKLVSRRWLLDAYGSDKKAHAAILEAQKKDFEYTSYRTPDTDSIVVIESWKLPTNSKSGDGRHVICIENFTLLDEGYSRTRFPFAFFRPKPNLSGFYGRSTVEGLMGYQIRLNKLNAVIEAGQDAACIPRVFLPQGSTIAKTQIDMTIGKIIVVQGEMPQAQTWTAFSPEMYNERDRVKAGAFQQEGVSEMSSQAKLPVQARLDSSEALREFNAIESERFSREAQLYEDFHLEIASLMVEAYAELHKNLKVSKKQSYRSRYLAEQIDWKDIDLKMDQYVFQVAASSILNMSPSARKDKLAEWKNNNVITMDQYKAYAGEPDLERLSDMLSAPHDYAEMVVMKLLEGEPLAPEPIANLTLTLDVVIKSYLHLLAMDNVPEEILQNFRDFIAMTKELIAPTPEVGPVDGMLPGDPAGAPPLPVDVAGAGLPALPPGMEMPGELPPLDPNLLPPIN